MAARKRREVRSLKPYTGLEGMADLASWPIFQNNGATPREEVGRWQMFSADELGRFSPVRWLTPRWLPAKELTVIYGKGDTYKSFVAQTWGFQLAAQRRTVIYIAAEGLSGLKPRAVAWQLYNEVPSLPTFFAITEAVNVHEGEVDDWITATKAQLLERGIGDTVDLVVVDTLARNFVGGDENSAQDMGAFVAGIERIRRDLDTAVVVIHHAGEKGPERGVKSLRNAVFAMFKTTDANKGNRRVKLTCDRMKDAEPPKPVTLHFNRVRMPPEFDIESWVDQPVSSLVMRDPFPPPKAARRSSERLSAPRAAIERLSDKKLRAALRAALRAGIPVSVGEIAKALKIGDSTARRRLNRLVEMGFLDRTGESVATRYKVTESGKKALDK